VTNNDDDARHETQLITAWNDEVVTLDEGPFLQLSVVNVSGPLISCVETVPFKSMLHYDASQMVTEKEPKW
jgi:hypothetical protein